MIVTVCKILDDIEYRGWEFRVGYLGDGLYIQVRFKDLCSESGLPRLQSGRKWYISRHATKSEIVQTALTAVLTAEEHEACEKFKYRGAAIFHPHWDSDDLVSACGHATPDRRKEG